MGRLSGRRLLVFAGFLAVLAGLLDARAWGEYPDPGRGAAHSVRDTRHEPSDTLGLVPGQQDLAGRAETTGRSGLSGPGAVLLRAWNPTAASGARDGIHHVAALPRKRPQGPTGSAYPLRLGADEPPEPPPVA